MGDMADHLMDMIGDDWDSHKPRQHDIQCRYCKNWGFHWAQTSDNKWRLHTSSGRIHTCSSHPINKRLEQLENPS